MDGLNLDKVFIPVDMLLGDLYLFLNQYADAATAYSRADKGTGTDGDGDVS